MLLEVVEEKMDQGIQQSYVLLKRELIEMISNWEYDAVLNLLQIKNLKSTVKNIAAHLRINVELTAEILARLQKLGLIHKENGRWCVKHSHTTTPADVPNAALRRLHRQYIQKAISSLRRDLPQERDITGITMAISKERLPEAKKRIKEFRRSLSFYLENGEKNEVYRLNIQLFPVRG